MSDSSIEQLKKQMHEAEREIDALECKIQFADLKTSYPDEYSAMRTEQEHIVSRYSKPKRQWTFKSKP